jgi:hypothetical protein
MYEIFRFELRTIGDTDRVHIVLSTSEGVPIACGAGPEALLAERGHRFVSLGNALGCDHGGTHRDPKSLWSRGREP